MTVLVIALVVVAAVAGWAYGFVVGVRYGHIEDAGAAKDQGPE